MGHGGGGVGGLGEGLALSPRLQRSVSNSLAISGQCLEKELYKHSAERAAESRAVQPADLSLQNWPVCRGGGGGRPGSWARCRGPDTAEPSLPAGVLMGQNSVRLS